ncbi:MliC family protein [bacterium]|nr:MliC family protein [bacterium]MBU1073099.1 MliC family protein [bacterium]MBU1674413.1 MliC family protein [bacterium]
MSRRPSLTILALAACWTGAVGCRGGADERAAAGTEIRDTFRTAPPEAYHFDCDDGTVMVVHDANLSGVDEVTVLLPGRTVRLPRLDAPAGERYGDGEVVYWRRSAREATLEVAGERLRNCVLDPALSKWEDAKLRGVSYRALGNEPGWVLEIGPERIVWITGYGGTRYVFPAATPEIDRDARRTTWRSADDGREIVIVVTGEPCLDDGDVAYPTTAGITFDGRLYTGCGRALH